MSFEWSFAALVAVVMACATAAIFDTLSMKSLDKAYEEWHNIHNVRDHKRDIRHCMKPEVVLWDCILQQKI